MTRTTAITFTVVLGFLLIGLLGVLFLLLFPYDRLFTPPSTPANTPTVIPTATPTLETFLPTASLVTPTPAEPTPTSTRVPTFTPGPTKTPTEEIVFPTPIPRPTSTPEAVQPPEQGTTAPTSTLPPQRGVDVEFTADSPVLVRGDCTDLIWQVNGPVTVQFEDETVPLSGTREVCPSRTTDYTLTVQVAGSAEVIPFQVRINVTQ